MNGSLTRQSSMPAWRSLPPWLQTIGVEAYGGNASQLAVAIASTKAPTLLTRECTTLRLVEPPGDNSMVRLQWQRGGIYGLAKLSHAANGTVVDIGANIGAISLTLARCHPTLRIIACEPSPVTYFYLLWNCVLNGVPVRVAMPSHPRPRTAGGIDALNVAVSRDGESTVTLSFDATHTQDTVLDSMVSRDVQVLGCGRSKGGGKCLPFRRSVVVPAIDLPLYLHHIHVPTIELLKVDCEGCWATGLQKWPLRERTDPASLQVAN